MHTDQAGDIDSVLEFWFGETGADGAVDPVKRRMWFGSGRKHDAVITGRFGALLERAARGALDDWTATPRGRLALIVVLDQFSRHVHRDSPRAFTQDAAASRWAREGVELGHDHALDPAHRAFFYMPFEHAEDRALQQLSVDSFRKLRDAVAAAQRQLYDEFLDYAARHQAVIERFGRFPHRNAVLGRESTPAEREFLTQPGSRF